MSTWRHPRLHALHRRRHRRRPPRGRPKYTDYRNGTRSARHDHRPATRATASGTSPGTSRPASAQRITREPDHRRELPLSSTSATSSRKTIPAANDGKIKVKDSGPRGPRSASATCSTDRSCTSDRKSIRRRVPGPAVFFTRPAKGGLTKPPRASTTPPRATPPHRGAPIWKDGRHDRPLPPTARPAQSRIFRPAPAPSAPAGRPKRSKDAALGRSHRAKIGKAKLSKRSTSPARCCEVPADYRIGIVPASDTGAVEMAMWSLLGARPVDMLAWESFGEGWVTDVVKQLKLADARIIKVAGYGELPDLAAVDTKTATSSSPGTAPRPACACRTPTGSRPTARASRSATRPRPPSRSGSTGRSSMS